jgi:hypothetical protein
MHLIQKRQKSFQKVLNGACSVSGCLGDVIHQLSVDFAQNGVCGLLDIKSLAK